MASSVFDINKELKTGINKFTNTVGKNGMCIPIALTYHQLVQVINALVGPIASMKAAIVNALDNNPVIDLMSNISKTLGVLNSGLNKIPKLSIDKSTLMGLDIFSKICLDFNDILPNAMKGFISESINSINDGFDELLDFILPDEFGDALNSVQDFMKSNALGNALDDISKAMLLPLTLYREYIKSSGILDMLKRLQKFEKCMTNPATCGRPKEEFYYPGTKKYNSQYYMDLLCVNLKGEIQLAKIKSNYKTLNASVNKTLNNIDNFKLIK